MKFRKIIIFLLTFSFVLACPFSSSAVDYNANTLDLDASTITQSNASSGTVNVTDYTSTMVVEDWSKGTWGVPFDCKSIYNSNSSYYSAGYIKTTIVRNNFNVKSNHNYTVSFYIGSSSNIIATINCYVYVYDGNGNNLQTIILYSYTGSLYVYNGNTYKTFDFNLENSDLPSGYSLKFGMDVSVPSYQDSELRLFISDISYVDNDDNTGLLNSIISGQAVIWNAVVDFNDDFNNQISTVISSINNNFNSFTSLFTEKLNAVLSDGNSHFAQLYSNLNNNFSSLITVLNSNFSTLNSNISNGVNSICSNIDSNFNSFTSTWNSGISAIRDDLRDYFKGDEYVNDTEDIDGINDDYSAAEDSLPGFEDSNINSILADSDVSGYAQGFLAVNGIFDSVVGAFGIGPVITFFLAIGLCIYLLGRRLKG